VQGPHTLSVGGDDGCSEEASKTPGLPGTENQTKLGHRPKLDQTNTT